MINKELLKEWLDRVYEVPVEKDERCRELLDQLPAMVEAKSQGSDGNGEYSELQVHLDGCAGCSELYEELRAIALLEVDGGLPDVETLMAEMAGVEMVVPD